MKTLHNYLLLLAVMFIMASCVTTKDQENKEENKKEITKEITEEGLHLTDEDKALKDFLAEHDLQDVLSDTNSAEYKEWVYLVTAPGVTRPKQTEEETIRFERLMDSLYNVEVSPNPTSSFVTLKFFTNWPNRHELFPQDITVDLYYLDQKVHTFDFLNSYGEETIPEQYLQKDGSYRIIYEGNSTPFMVRKN